MRLEQVLIGSGDSWLTLSPYSNLLIANEYQRLSGLAVDFLPIPGKVDLTDESVMTQLLWGGENGSSPAVFFPPRPEADRFRYDLWSSFTQAGTLAVAAARLATEGRYAIEAMREKPTFEYTLAWYLLYDSLQSSSAMLKAKSFAVEAHRYAAGAFMTFSELHSPFVLDTADKLNAEAPLKTEARGFLSKLIGMYYSP